MEDILKNNWFKLSLLIIIIFVIGGIFYWFQLRPVKITKYCHQWATDRARALGAGYDNYNDYFKWCLQEQGL